MTEYTGSTITAAFNVSVSYQLNPKCTVEHASAFIAHKLDEAAKEIEKTLEHLGFGND